MYLLLVTIIPSIIILLFSYIQISLENQENQY